MRAIVQISSCYRYAYVPLRTLAAGSCREESKVSFQSKPNDQQQRQGDLLHYSREMTLYYLYIRTELADLSVLSDTSK